MTAQDITRLIDSVTFFIKLKDRGFFRRYAKKQKREGIRIMTDKKQAPKKAFSYFCIVLAAICWGVIGFFTKSLTDIGISTMSLVFLRGFFAVITLGMFLLLTKRSALRIRIKDLWCFLCSGVFSIFFMTFFYFYSMKHTSLAVSSVLIYVAPAVVTLLSALIFGERMTGKKWLAILLTFVGCALVCGIFDGEQKYSLVGILFGIGSGISYASYSIFSRIALNKGYDSMTISFYSFVFFTLTAMPFADMEGIVSSFGIKTIFLSAGLGLVCCTMPFVLYTEGMKRVDNSHASVVATLEPCVATLLGVAAYGEELRASIVAGVAILILGIAIMNKKDKNAENEAKTNYNLKYKAVLFDLDGTLLKTLPDLCSSVNYALSVCGMEEKSEEFIRLAVGNGIKKTISRCIEGGEENPRLSELVALFDEHYKKNSAEGTRPYDGIPELLSELKKAGYLIAVVSNKEDSALRDLTEKFFPNLVDFSVGEMEARGVRRKPAPDMAEIALRELRVNKDEAVFVGDSAVDIETAENSGLPCISVLWGFRTREEIEQTHKISLAAANAKELKDLLL